MQRWLVRILVVVAALVGIAYCLREAILLEMVGVAARSRYGIGPHQDVAWSVGPAAPAAARRPPNIVLIVADDLGWNDLTFRGGGVAGGTVPTPHIDSIAAEGVQFTRAYSGNGTCAPSRAAMMAGRYPTRFGFEFTPTPPGMLRLVSRLGDPRRLRKPITYFDERGDQAVPYDEMGVPASEITLAETLASAMYHTVHIGKWHLGRANGMAPHDQGFDESLLMASGLYLPEDHPEVVNSKQDFDPIDKFLWAGMRYAASFNGGDAFEPGGYLTDYYTDEAIKVVEANKHRPFFLYLAHWAPHTPLQATRADYDALSHIEDHRLRVYAAMIRALDRGVGRVLDALEQNGLADDTLVLFTSDNGGAHYIGLPEVNEPFRGWKISFFEGGIHVPLFARWPAAIPAGIRYDEPVHHFDIYATAAAAAGTPMPTDRRMDGVDLLPFVRGEVSGVPHERLFWRQGHYQVVLADGWKLQVTERPDATWLFDMRGDPTEQRNLAAEQPERVEAMKSMLAAHNASQLPPAWPSLIEAPINIDKDITRPDAPDDEYVYWPN
ncbi:MAG: sulfatase-like hydrolase/transferase [Myxococcota bacterium]